MAYKQKTWQEKLHTGAKPKVKKVESTFADIPAGSSILIATPEVVDNYINQIPIGAHTSLQQMRNDLAAEYHAQYTCPVTSGIFLRIAAEATYEAYTAGTPLQKITPFWRIIDSKSPTSKKLTFGTTFIKEQRAKEGLTF